MFTPDLEILDTAALIAMKAEIEAILAKREASEAPTPAHGAQMPSSAATAAAGLTIWVDGSYNTTTSEYSFGVVVLDGASESYYRKKFPYDPEMSGMRNVAGEVEAASFAIKKAVELGAKSCHIVYDYKGIEMWPTRAWKANKAGTRAYVQLYDTYKDQCAFSFEHVDAHTGVDYNEYCDTLAKSAVGNPYDKKYESIVAKSELLN